MRPSSARAVEQREVEVSMKSSLDIGQQIFQERKHLCGKTIQNRINLRRFNHFRLHQPELGVQWLEYKYHYADYQCGLENRENKSQKSVGPAQSGHLQEFAIAIFDLNDLKITNDTLGHSTGDDLIRAACALICDVFQHSPVFRIGGDEFAVMLSGRDYENREALLGKIRETSAANRKRRAGVVVASGISLFDPQSDHTVADVFKRADQEMYKNKRELKAMA